MKPPQVKPKSVQHPSDYLELGNVDNIVIVLILYLRKITSRCFCKFEEVSAIE